jgi:hypothetical protein
LTGYTLRRIIWDVFEIETTAEFDQWLDSLTTKQRAAIVARLDVLRREGPALKRPIVGEISGSAYDPQMKELRVGSDGALRVLFIFDPRRVAVLLVGGDKTGQWKKWYRRAIRDADRLYAEHLKRI